MIMQTNFQKIKQQIKSSLFIKNASILFVGTMIVNVLNYVFNLVIARLLSVGEYGDLVALESIFLIIGVFGTTLVIITTRRVASLKARNDLQELKVFKRYVEKLCIAFGFLVCLVLLIFSKNIAVFLKTPLGPVIVLDISFIFAFISFFYAAILQGLQRFRAFAILAVVGAIGKLVVGIGLVALGFSTAGAMLGYVFPSIIGVFLIYFVIRDIDKIRINYKRPKLKIAKTHLLTLSKYFFATLCLTLLYNTDLLMVKHYFSPEEGGLYSSLAMLARIIFFGTGVIAMILLPMATERYEKKQNHLNLFLFSCGVIAAVSVLLSIIYFLFPNFIISLLFGAKYLSGADLLGYMALMMSVYALLNIEILYLISIKRFQFLWPLIIGAILQPILISYFHASLFQVIMVTFIIISGILITAGINLFRNKKAVNI